ncbi:hypothetical protein D3C72_1561120 [compost metagenome]
MLQPLVLAGQGHVRFLRRFCPLKALAGIDQAANELLDLLADLFAVGIGAAAQGRFARIALVVLALHLQAAGVRRGWRFTALQGAVVGDHRRLRGGPWRPDRTGRQALTQLQAGAQAQGQGAPGLYRHSRVSTWVAALPGLVGSMNTESRLAPANSLARLSSR